MLHRDAYLLDERSVVYQVSDGLSRLVDPEFVEIYRGMPFLAAVPICVFKSRKSSKGCMETSFAAIHSEYNYAEYVGGGVLFHQSGFCVFAFQYRIFVGHNIIGAFFRRRATEAEKLAIRVKHFVFDNWRYRFDDISSGI
jgi:hypothetical protein